jgi:succinate-semialdehyde dehydrogenase/glutarate-semialdehyde dehydrogenase
MAVAAANLAPGACQGESIAVRNPRSGAVDYHFQAPSAGQLTEMASRLRAAQPQWRARPLAERIAVLQRFKGEYLARRDSIVQALSTDTGRYAISLGEFAAVLSMIDRWSAMAPQLAESSEGQSIVHPSITYRSQYVPYALVGVISPWNFPLTLALIDAVPALLAGCAALIKPSEVTPRFVTPLRAALDAVPELAEVLQIWPGAGATGAQLVSLADVICFTGSVKTGRLVAENAAKHFIPAFLELGGNDPIIVTASADIERAADIVLRASVLATGQACQSLERVYVDRKIFQPFVDKLTAKAAAVEPNWPDMHRGTIGPFIFGRQADIVAGQIADAVAKGARVLTGGQIEDHGGKWLRPTVLVDVNHSMAVMSEETFGPVMPVMPYDTVDQAIGLANEGVFGLSAGVIAGTLAEAEAIGLRIDAGGISLNDGSLTGVMYEAEKNSFKLSGMGGSRMGPAGYLRFLRKKALIRQTGAPVTIGMMSENAAAPGPQR